MFVKFLLNIFMEFIAPIFYFLAKINTLDRGKNTKEVAGC